MTVEEKDLSAGGEVCFRVDVCFQVGNGEGERNFENEDILGEGMAMGRDVDIYMRPAGQTLSVCDRSEYLS